MTTTMQTQPVVVTDGVPAQDDVSRTAAHLYDAETALHVARQTGVDAWVAAAYDRLHEAVVAYRSAVTGHAA